MAAHFLRQSPCRQWTYADVIISPFCYFGIFHNILFLQPNAAFQYAILLWTGQRYSELTANGN